MKNLFNRTTIRYLIILLLAFLLTLLLKYVAKGQADYIMIAQ